MHEWRERGEQELRAEERKRDEWWKMRLARKCRVINGGRGGARGGRRRGTGRGGYGEHSGEHGDEFPYHVRSWTSRLCIRQEDSLQCNNRLAFNTNDLYLKFHEC